MGLETIFLAPNHEKQGRSLLAFMHVSQRNQSARRYLSLQPNLTSRPTLQLKTISSHHGEKFFNLVWSINPRIFLSPHLGFDNVPK
jgi:hypothetical protein